MGVMVPGDKSGGGSINDFNLWMRQQPWYQQWFQARGLNANQVKLSKEQRQDLERTVIQNGAPQDAFNDMMIDPAGNLNKEHGFASLPTWAKVAIGAGAVVGGVAAAPAVGGALGIGGGAAPGAAGTSGMTLGGAAGAGSAGASGTAAAAGGSWFSGSTLASLGGIGAGLASNIYSARTQASAAEKAALAQLEASRAAGTLESEAAKAQLEFLREQEARRQLEWDKSQQLNREQYERTLALEMERYNRAYGLDQERLRAEQGRFDSSMALDRERYGELQERLAPYRQMGQEAFNRIGTASVAPAAGFIPARATMGAA